MSITKTILITLLFLHSTLQWAEIPINEPLIEEDDKYKIVSLKKGYKEILFGFSNMLATFMDSHVRQYIQLFLEGLYLQFEYRVLLLKYQLNSIYKTGMIFSGLEMDFNIFNGRAIVPAQVSLGALFSVGMTTAVLIKKTNAHGDKTDEVVEIILGFLISFEEYLKEPSEFEFMKKNCLKFMNLLSQYTNGLAFKSTSISIDEKPIVVESKSKELIIIATVVEGNQKDEKNYLNFELKSKSKIIQSYYDLLHLSTMAKFYAKHCMSGKLNTKGKIRDPDLVLLNAYRLHVFTALIILDIYYMVTNTYEIFMFPKKVGDIFDENKVVPSVGLSENPSKSTFVKFSELQFNLLGDITDEKKKLFLRFWSFVYYVTNSKSIYYPCLTIMLVYPKAQYTMSKNPSVIVKSNNIRETIVYAQLQSTNNNSLPRNEQLVVNLIIMHQPSKFKEHPTRHEHAQLQLKIRNALMKKNLNALGFPDPNHPENKIFLFAGDMNAVTQELPAMYRMPVIVLKDTDKIKTILHQLKHKNFVSLDPLTALTLIRKYSDWSKLVVINMYFSKIKKPENYINAVHDSGLINLMYQAACEAIDKFSPEEKESFEEARQIVNDFKPKLDELKSWKPLEFENTAMFSFGDSGSQNKLRPAERPPNDDFSNQFAFETDAEVNKIEFVTVPALDEKDYASYLRDQNNKLLTSKSQKMNIAQNENFLSPFLREDRLDHITTIFVCSLIGYSTPRLPIYAKDPYLSFERSHPNERYGSDHKQKFVRLIFDLTLIFDAPTTEQFISDEAMIHKEDYIRDWSGLRNPSKEDVARIIASAGLPVNKYNEYDPNAESPSTIVFPEGGYYRDDSAIAAHRRVLAGQDDDIDNL